MTFAQGDGLESVARVGLEYGAIRAVAAQHLGHLRVADVDRDVQRREATATLI